MDKGGLYREAIHLLSRLQFAESDVLLAHACEPVRMPAYAGSILAPVDELEAERLSSMREVLREATEMASLENVGEAVIECPLDGKATEQIMEIAAREHADLVAVGSRRHGILGSFFTGSVGRALAIGARESFLIARSGVVGRGDVRAVFATDHSKYADACLEELLRLDPLGITELHFVFAQDGEMATLAEAAGESGEVPQSVEELVAEVKAKGALLVESCIDSGRLADYEMVFDFTIEALRKKMYDLKADLLILGAQGHGFIERLLIGSLALHEVVAEPFSVLVLRIPEDD
ncbi:putative universal stress protein UspA [Fimbriimonas ginsengisoli Gsoil 348]|uniref:Putative universal stress protein UspA n=1 Tax=Fimbriimonas ginsengisoli Gsoil 348 TaxID=661478 RepID=A0A068NSV9_FIMGI|nr:putative universal stress protein UspA [Fimbriimonas ginsengisoli Gsoil 348]